MKTVKVTFTTKLDINGVDISASEDMYDLDYFGPETNYEWLTLATGDNLEELESYMHLIAE